MKTKSTFVIAAIIAITASSLQKANAQSWLLAGNNATAGSKLGTLNGFPLRLYANGKEWMRISTNGNVGIGTTAPIAKLHVVGTGTRVATFDGPTGMYTEINENGAARGYFGSIAGNNEDFEVGTNSLNANGKLHLTIKAVPKFTIDASGNVGIGTTAPIAALQVKGTGTRVAVFDGPTGMYTEINENGAARGYFGSVAGNNEDFEVGTNSLNSTGKLHLTIKAVPKFTIDASGNVGIGTTAPMTNLHIFRGSSGTVTPNANSPLIIENSTNNYISLLTPSASEKGIIFGDNVTPVNGAILYNSSENMLFQTGKKVTRMILTAAGNLEIKGVGTGLFFAGGQFIRDVAGTGSPIEVHGDFVPDNTASHSFGSSTKEWTEIWAVDGSVNIVSSKTAKNVTDLNYGLKEIMKLRPVSYNKINNPEGGDGAKRLGILADEVKKVIPEVVKDWKYSEDQVTKKITKVSIDDLGISLENIIPVLVKGMQEQQKLIDAQNKKIEDLIKLVQQSQQSQIPAQESNAVTSKSVNINATLEQNSPNPFNSSTIIRYHIPSSANNAQIMVSNATGNTVKTFTLTGKDAGFVTINASELTAGSYYYTLMIDGKKVDSKKMVLIK